MMLARYFFFLSLVVPVAARDTSRILLSDPMLQLPTASSVRVVWYTEWRGSGHRIVYGDGLTRTTTATTSLMSRMLEDAGSRIRERQQPTEVVLRPIWRHEAIATGLEQNRRVPYRAISLNEAGEEIRSDEFTLQPLPSDDRGMLILLTSDQQNRLMAPANYQKIEETFGRVDAVFMAGDFVDNPHRASEWFDRYDPAWLNTPTQPNRPAFPNARPAFFPSIQGWYQRIFPEFPYRGGRIAQHAPIFGSIGNHESPGRWRPNERFMLNGQMTTASIDFMDNDPQPRWFAEAKYEQIMRSTPSFNPTNDPRIKEQFIRENSFEWTQYFEMWNHPQDGPQGEAYWWYRMGNTCVISMNVSRVWRTFGIGNNDRGKFVEFRNELNNPNEWGFGDMWFERFNQGSEQYRWLEETLQRPECQQAKYRMVIGHQTMFGLGDNAIPVMANPQVTILYREGADTRELKLEYPVSLDRWNREIQPLANAQRIVEVRYEYPVDRDEWRNDIEPLLQRHNVQMVHTGHSHVWNRARVGNLNYIESSNVGNSFGAFWAGPNGAWRERFPGSFAQELQRPNSRWNPRDYVRSGDPHNRRPEMPTLFNPMREMEGTAENLPFVDSNNVTVFTIFDSRTGAVSSYAFDTRRPDSPVVKFDEFVLTSR